MAVDAKIRKIAAQPKARRSDALGISRGDVFLLGRLPILGLIAWFVPERQWGRICDTVARLLLNRGRDKTVSICNRIEAALGQREPSRLPLEVAIATEANRRYERLVLLRCYRPFANRPATRLEGAHHLTRAFSDGQGGILWRARFTFDSLVTMIALYEAGLKAGRLTSNRHGFSGTAFGRRVLNPVRTTAERRYALEPHLLSATDDGRELKAEALRRLGENRAISIVASTQIARRVYPVPFMGGSLPMAAGAAALALQSGAALLPVFTVREPSGEFVTTIEAPLTAPATASRDEAIRHLLVHYVMLMESYVARYPDQFRGWSDVIPPEIAEHGRPAVEEETAAG